MKDTLEPTLVVTTFAALPIGTAFRQQHAGGRSHARYRKISATEARILTKYPDTDPVVPVPPERHVVVAALAEPHDRVGADAGTGPKVAAARYGSPSPARDRSSTSALTSDQLAASRAFWREAFAGIPQDSVDDEGADAGHSKRLI